MSGAKRWLEDAPIRGPARSARPWTRRRRDPATRPSPASGSGHGSRRPGGIARASWPARAGRRLADAPARRRRCGARRYRDRPRQREPAPRPSSLATAPGAEPAPAGPPGARGNPLARAARRPEHRARRAGAPPPRPGGGRRAPAAHGAGARGGGSPPEVKVGRVRFSVPHQPPGQRFSVRAGAFQVVVLGTVFDVAVEEAGVSVAVASGTVEVHETASDRLVQRLPAGASWSSEPAAGPPAVRPPPPRRAVRPPPGPLSAQARPAHPRGPRRVSLDRPAIRSAPSPAIRRWSRRVGRRRS